MGTHTGLDSSRPRLPGNKQEGSREWEGHGDAELPFLALHAAAA